MRPVVDEFVDAALRDSAVDYTRGGTYPMGPEALARTKRGAFDFLSHALGGPAAYAGRSLPDIHAGMGITDSEFDAFVGHFKLALERHGVGARFVAQLMDAVKAVRELIVSPCNTGVAPRSGHTTLAVDAAPTASSATQTSHARPCH
jgi:hemoglobin